MKNKIIYLFVAIISINASTNENDYEKKVLIFKTGVPLIIVWLARNIILNFILSELIEYNEKKITNLQDKIPNVKDLSQSKINLIMLAEKYLSRKETALKKLEKTKEKAIYLK